MQVIQNTMKGDDEYADGVITQYQKRLEYIRSNSILAPAYLRKKVLVWAFRTVIAILVYLILWKYSWIRWTLIITVPVCILNLISVFTWKYLLREKLKRNEKELEELKGTLQKSAGPTLEKE